MRFNATCEKATNRGDLATGHRTPDWRLADHLNKHLSLSISKIIAQDETLADSLGARDCNKDKQWKLIPLEAPLQQPPDAGWTQRRPPCRI